MDAQDRDVNQGEKPEDEAARRAVSRKRWVVIGALAAVVAAVVLIWSLNRGSSQGSIAGRPVPAPTGESVPTPPGEGSTGSAPRPGEIVITLSPDKLENAQLKIEVVAEQPGTPSAGAGSIRTTGTVQSNAYKEIPIFPLVGGIIRQINVELGDKVKRGQPLATIFSSELADAEAAYLKMAAEVDEHHKHHNRTIDLVEIGAASREELEQATSMKKSAEANLAAARERLILLGLTEKQADDLRTAQKFSKPLVAVEAPASGTLIGRAVNTGEVVMQGKEMFRVADLSSVWVVAQIYEKDFQSVNLATPATITTSAYPGRTFSGRVSYIDPRVDPQTRTAQVRIELANPKEALRLGMFVDVNFGGAPLAAPGGQTVPVVPRAALQSIGSKQVVYVAADRPGSFVQREVVTGQEINGELPVFNGVRAGERVVGEGSFLLRAESLRLNPGQSMAPEAPASGEPATAGEGRAQGTSSGTRQEDGVQAVTIRVTDKGFQPDRIDLKRGVPARLTFVREIDETCATAVMIPEFNLKQDLPLKEPIVFEFTPAKPGVFDFTCGMKMLSGKIVVR